MQPHELAQFTDHAVLRPDASSRDLDRACDETLQFRFRGICVPSGAVGHAKRRLKDTGIKVSSTVGFPHGNSAPDVKAWEATRAAAMGADEIDYVVSIGALMDNDFRFIREEAVAIMRGTRGKIIKGILEVGYLNDEQKWGAAQALSDAGVPYVKTCTGFGPGMATEDDVRLLVRAIAGRALVKASGGIRERWQAIQLLSAGAAVIGTSHGIRICSPEV